MLPPFGVFHYLQNRQPHTQSITIGQVMRFCRSMTRASVREVCKRISTTSFCGLFILTTSGIPFLLNRNVPKIVICFWSFVSTNGIDVKHLFRTIPRPELFKLTSTFSGSTSSSSVDTFVDLSLNFHYQECHQ